MERDGGPLPPKLEKQWEQYDKKVAHRLTAHPLQETELGDMIPSSIASQFLRIIRPTSSTRSPDGAGGFEIEFAVETDPEAWEKFDGSTRTRYLKGTVLVDESTLNVSDFHLTSSRGDSFRGGLGHVAPGASFHYKQMHAQGLPVPQRYEVGLKYRIGLGAQTSYAYSCNFDNFSLPTEKSSTQP